MKEQLETLDQMAEYIGTLRVLIHKQMIVDAWRIAVDKHNVFPAPVFQHMRRLSYVDNKGVVMVQTPGGHYWGGEYLGSASLTLDDALGKLKSATEYLCDETGNHMLVDVLTRGYKRMAEEMRE